MSGGSERVQPVGRSWHILGKIREVVDGLMRGFDSMVSPGLELVAVGYVFEVRVVLVAGRCAEE